VLGVALVVHLLAPRAVRVLWAGAAAAGLFMGTGLVVIGAHWVSDVVGGLLLGFAVLAGVTAIDGGTPETARYELVSEKSVKWKVAGLPSVLTTSTPKHT